MMDIKTIKLIHIKAGNVGWIEKHYKFHSGQKASWHTHTHTIKCFNGIGKDITDTEIGLAMIKAVKQSLAEEV
jgi:hypothetical protein